MKISHSIIVLTSVIFVTGSMITVGMDLKRTTNNVYTNVEIAKQKHFQEKEMCLHETKKNEERKDSVNGYETNMDKINKQKIALKLKYLNQHNNFETIK